MGHTGPQWLWAFSFVACDNKTLAEIVRMLSGACNSNHYYTLKEVPMMHARYHPITHLMMAFSLAVVLMISCLIFLGHATHTQASPAIHYVSATDPTCGGQLPCYSNVQAALDNANNDDSIKVATGVYTGVFARLVGTRVLTQVVLINKTIFLRGGYTTTDWVNSHPLTYPTTIDAQGKGRGIYIAQSVSVTIEGFTITNGNAVGLGGKQYWNGTGDAGGGIYAGYANVTLRNNTIVRNTSGSDSGSCGGGLYTDDGSASISGNVFVSNTAGGWGGGVALYQGAVSVFGNIITGNTTGWGGGGLFQEGSDSATTISGNLVQNNSSPTYNGGGMYIAGSSASIIGNIMTGNSSQSGGGIHLNADKSLVVANRIFSNTANYGGGISFYLSQARVNDNLVLSNTASRGGGIAMWGVAYDLTVSRNTIEGNLAQFGGGVYVPSSDSSGQVTLNANRIANNSATAKGGGVSIDYDGWGSSPGVALNHCVITSNTAGIHGGGLYVYSGTTTLDSSYIQNNSASDSGGGLWIDSGSIFTSTNNILTGNRANSVAGAAYIQNSRATFLHDTVAANTAGTVYNGFIAANGALVRFTNTILVSHTTGLATTGSGVTVTADHTLWWATPTYTDTSGGGLISTTTNLTGNPKFDANYHITGTSAALDTGIGTGIQVDIDGQPRPHGAGFDIGADEFYFLPYSVYLPVVVRENTVALRSPVNVSQILSHDH
jgi:hypothetical protein